MTDLHDLIQQYHFHLNAYEIVCRKSPNLTINGIYIHQSPKELKQFDRKLGVWIQGDNLHLYENFGNETFFMEFAALLSFIPDRFRSFNIIRRILFIILYPKYEQSIAKISWLNDKFHTIIRKLEQDLSSQSSVSFYDEDALYTFIRTVRIPQILRELIPYLDSGIKKSEIIENIHYLFSPYYEFSYKMMTEVYSHERIFNEFFSNPQKTDPLPHLIPIANTFNFTFKYLNLSQFYISFHLSTNYTMNFRFLEEIQELLAKIPFFSQIQLSNNKYIILCLFPPESISIVSEFLYQLQQSKIIEMFYILEISKNFIEMAISKCNLIGIHSQSISLEKSEKIDIRKSETFQFNYSQNKLITPFDFFMALNGRTFIPVLGTIQSKKDISLSIQRAIKGYLLTHKNTIQPYLPSLYPLSSRILSKKNIMEFYQSSINSKILQFSPLLMLLYLQRYESVIFDIFSTHKSIIIEEFIAFKNSFELILFINPISSKFFRNVIQFSWKDILVGLATLSFEPFSTYFNSWIPKKIKIDVSIGKYFNFQTQKWDFNQFSFSEYKQKIVELSKSLDLKKNTQLPKVESRFDHNKYEMLTSLTTIRRIIKKYRTLYHHLNIPNMKKNFIIQYVKDSLQARHFLSSSETHMYPKPLRYIENNSLSMNPFIHPMLSNFSRIHIILTSRGLWLHPKSISSHEILRGLFTIGLVQCYFAGGTQDGILLLEYLIPTAFYIDSGSEFHRLIKKIKNTAGNYSVRIMEINNYALSMNEWNLRAETFKTKQFMKFSTSRRRKGQSVQNQNPIYNLYYNKMPYTELPSSYNSKDPSTIPHDNLPELYTHNVVFDPAIKWQLLLFLKHSFYFFIWIRNIPQNGDKKAKIIHFFQQFPIVEIFTSTANESGNLDFYMIVHFRNNIYFLERKILNQFSEWNLEVSWHYLFPYEIIRYSPITKIMEISRQNPFQKLKLNPRKFPIQFPILRYYQQNNCFSPEETVQIYNKYYSSPQDLVENINQIKKEFSG
ncbi:MAG: hypothetical protein ACTSYI_07755 [Promethearchaeota archaeon]